jgi:hypothetical protein
MSKTGFLLAEDEALKLRLTGLTVSDDREPTRPVQVFFRYPEGETEKHYPFITIELLDINHARTRQHSEVYLYSNYAEHPNNLTYWPSTADLIGDAAGQDFLRVNDFMPVDITYQVSTYCRSAQHDRQLTAKMLTTVTPYRFGSILIAADNTSRRLEMLDWANADLLDQETGYRKRIFRKIYTLQMTSELSSEALVGVKQVTSVQTTLVQTND